MTRMPIVGAVRACSEFVEALGYGHTGQHWSAILAQFYAVAVMNGSGLIHDGFELVPGERRHADQLVNVIAQDTPYGIVVNVGDYTVSRHLSKFGNVTIDGDFGSVVWVHHCTRFTGRSGPIAFIQAWTSASFNRF